jgi:hypothetical protein
MKKVAITGALKPPRTYVVAIICGTLCSVAAALPAQSADLYPYPYDYSGYGPAYSGYYHGCSTCGCSTCGCRPCCNSCGHRPVVIQPAPVVERHWDYWERRYPASPYRYPTGYAGYPDSPYPGGYVGYPYSPYPNDYPAYSSGPRPHLGFGGVQYPPAPISYEYQTPPPAYEYQAAAPSEYRAPMPPAYDQAYERPPRPPAGIRGPYSNASYIQ